MIIEGEGATLVSTRIHAADQAPAFWFKGVLGQASAVNQPFDFKLHYVNFVEGNPIADRRSRLHFANGDLVRIGGEVDSFVVGSEVVGCNFDGGYSGGLSHRCCSEILVQNVRIRRAFGDGINSEHAPRDVTFRDIIIEDSTDDGCIVKHHPSQVPGGTVNAVMENITVRRSDAKGCVMLGVHSGRMEGIWVYDTAVQAIAFIGDPTGEPVLPYANRCIIKDFHVFRAGKWYGADPELISVRPCTAPRAASTFRVTRNERQGRADRRTVRSFDTQNRAVVVSGGSRISVDNVDIDTATGEAVLVGNPDVTDRTVIKEVSLSRIRSRDTVGGLTVGSTTGFGMIPAATSDASGRRRGSPRDPTGQRRERHRQQEHPRQRRFRRRRRRTILQVGTNVNVDVRPDNIEINNAGGRVSSYVQQYLAFATYIVPVLALGRIKHIAALTADLSIDTPAAGTFAAGSEVTFVLTQDATGGRRVTWGAQYVSTWQPDFTPNAVSTITFRYNGQVGLWVQAEATPEHQPARVLGANVGPITAQTTLQNITGLPVYIGASATEIHEFESDLLVSAANGTMDIKLGFTVPAGCTMLWGSAAGLTSEVPGFGARNVAGAPLALLAEGGNIAVSTAAGTTGLTIKGRIFGGGTAGIVQPQYAQVVSDGGNLAILKGSSIKQRRLA